MFSDDKNRRLELGGICFFWFSMCSIKLWIKNFHVLIFLLYTESIEMPGFKDANMSVS